MKINLEDWQDVELLSEYRRIHGRVAYGYRKPIAPSTEPLIEGHQRSNYWFINEDQKVKVRLYFPRLRNEEIRAIGRDTKFFRVRIRKTLK